MWRDSGEGGKEGATQADYSQGGKKEETGTKRDKVYKGGMCNSKAKKGHVQRHGQHQKRGARGRMGMDKSRGPEREWGATIGVQEGGGGG